jgi:hypothetical protein
VLCGSPEWDISSLPLGTEALSTVVPTGSYTLQARLPGGRVASMPVTLLDGQTSSAVLTFP